MFIISFSSTKKIVGLSTVSRKEHVCAQTREVACTKIVLPEVIDKGMFKHQHYEVVFIFCALCVRSQVAHDNQSVVKKFSL